MLGALSAGWTVRSPALKAKLDLSDSQLGLEVLGWGLATIAAMHFSAGLLRRHGTSRVLKIALPGLALSVAPVGLAPNFGLLIVGGVLFGLCYGFAEVGATTGASTLEASSGRPLMGGMHASWAFGAVVGGLIGAGGAAVGLTFTSWMLGLSAAGLILTLTLVLGLHTPPADTAIRQGGKGSRLPRMVLLFGVITAASFLAEGTIADWGGIYLVGFPGTSQAIAALAYPATEAIVIGSRLLADRISGPGRIRTIMLITAPAGAAGFVLVAAAPNVPVAVLGFVLVGGTVGVIAPLALSAAGAVAELQREAAVARVSTFGYGGFLVGPVLIGFAADAFTLGSAFLIASAACLVAAVCSLFLR